MQIAIVDVLGLPYDGATLSKRGLGGSESAVIYMSAELVKLGFQVTVYCACDVDDAHAGSYDGVIYKPLPQLAHDPGVYDVIISSRSVEPFVPADWDRSWCRHDASLYRHVQHSKAHKVLWMHDTFCSGDHVLEQLVMQDHFHELFVLSDWHMTYVLNCDHGARRNYEVLKSKTWITRNGVNTHMPYVDVSKKDPWQFVYNASVSKGMQVLLEHIWPRIHAAHPEVKLKVIGGYYKFRSDQEPDAQEQLWHRLKETHDHKQNVQFTGIITQKQIAEILATSTAMIYPNAFPETFGISALESLCYNTPLITNRFGALEETALDTACYKVNYAIQPNSLFTQIDTTAQVDAFVNLVLQVIQNRYLLQQKQHACSIVKPWVTWDKVALQWKQHLFRISDRMLSSEEFTQCDLIRTRIQQIFGRRTLNPEDHQVCQIPEQPIVFISAFRNVENYISRCIMSVATQQYSHVQHILIDDASTDASHRMATRTIQSCPTHIQSRIQLWQNDESVGAVSNQFRALQWVKQMHSPNTIVCLLDGDDWLVNRNDVCHLINRHMDDSCDFSYGSCWSVADQIPLIAQEYPPEVKHDRAYRSHPFNWIIPYTHMRAFRIHLFDDHIQSAWQNDQGEWWRAGGDVHTFYSLIERVHPERVKVMQDVIVNYNDVNPLNDYKVNASEQTQTAHAAVNLQINVSEKSPPVTATKCVALAQPHIHTPLRVLLAIPTARHVEVATFKSLWDLHRPPNVELDFQYFYGYNVQQVRNTQVLWMLNHGYDHMLHVDSDMVLPAHTLECLLDMQTERRAITSGIYVQRKDVAHTCEVYVHDAHTGGHTHMHLDQLMPERVCDVAAVGFGGCLVRRDVYEKIQEPWFEYHMHASGAPRVSEDVDFCMKAQQTGFDVGVHTGLRYGHIHQTILHVP
jgi:glycosyltransferase involved in cell wall biosynthesis